jgi:di/tricarboxylate transporter
MLSMISDTTFVFVLMGVVAVLMASNRVRFDMVALFVVLALMLSGVLTVSEALSGFSNSVVIIVAGLLVVGEMLDRTGVARAVGDWILTKGGSSETKLLMLIMASAGLLGAAMSSTAVVAIFIPIVLRVAAQTGLNPSRMLLPMSYAALISGMVTLIATPANLVVSAELATHGFEPLGFFSFTLVGVGVLVVAIGYVLTIGRRLLPGEATAESGAPQGRSMEEIWHDYRLDRIYATVRISGSSALAGQTLAEAGLGTQYGARVVGIGRRESQREEHVISPPADFTLHAQDVLLLVVDPTSLERLCTEQEVERSEHGERDRQRLLWEMGAVTALIHPASQLIGKSLRDAEFRSRYGIDVVGLRRSNEAVSDFEDLRLQASDSLLGIGTWSRIQQLKVRNHDFVVLETPSEAQDIVPAYRRMPVALVILGIMVVLSVFDVVPLVAAVLMAAVAAVTTRCLTAEDSYRAIHWSSLILVAGMLPLADALESTGGTDLVVEALLAGIGGAGPQVMFTVLFFLTALLGLFLSNTASAVLVAPIAITAAASLGVSPYPFAIGVLIAASAAFVTPVSTPVVTLVVGPGRYRFIDFVKVGVPLLMLTYVTTLLLVPLVFPW